MKNLSLLLALLLAGCGTTKTYNGPKRKDTELAKVEAVRYTKFGMPSRFEGLFILECNGKVVGSYMRGYPKVIDVLPGQAKVTLTYNHNLDKSLFEVAASTGALGAATVEGHDETKLKEFSFDVQKGHYYKIMFYPVLLSKKAGLPPVWVIDTTTKQIVYGKVPSGIPDPANIEI